MFFYQYSWVNVFTKMYPSFRLFICSESIAMAFNRPLAFRLWASTLDPMGMRPILPITGIITFAKYYTCASSEHSD